MAREVPTLSKRTGGDTPIASFTPDQSLYYNRPLVKIKNLPLAEEPVVSSQEN